MKSLAILILISLAPSLNIQNTPNDLVGKWECYHKELKDGSVKSTNINRSVELDYSCELIIEFKNDFTCWESICGLNFKYQKNDSILTLGNRKYIIEFLTKNELIIRDYYPRQTHKSIFRQKFKKRE